MMDLKDRSLRRLNSKSLRRDGFKVFSSKPLDRFLTTPNNKKAFLARTTNQPNLSSPRCSFVVSLFLFPFFGRIKFLSCVLVTFRMKNVSVSSFDEENLSLKTNVESINWPKGFSFLVQQHVQKNVGGVLKKKRARTYIYHHTTLMRFTIRQRFRTISIIYALINYSNILILILNARRIITLRPRTPNQVGEDNYCRGGIVNTRGSRSRRLFVRTRSPTALWRFRASTSNSVRGLMWPHTHTPFRQIDRTYAQQDIRVCGGDHFEPPEWQFSNPKSLWLLRVSI